MSTMKTLAWGALFLVTASPALRADSIAASNGSWVFFGNGATLESQYPNLYTVSSASSPVTVAPSPAPVASTPSAASFPAITPDPAPSASPQSGGPVNAFLNFGTAPYPEVSQLTTGTPQPWYTSPAVTKVFGGNEPNASQQAAFETQVLLDVQHTFSLAGMNPNLTITPGTSALHTLSVVSGISYAQNANAIGITDVGNNGFSFIDKLTYANSASDLEWAVAHNVAHELMHAFGIGYHPDQTGQYIDAPSATWAQLTSQNTTFSPAAAKVITATGFGSNIGTGLAPVGQQQIDGDQEILAAPVPEPTTITLWTFALAGVVLHIRRTSQRAA